MIPQAITTLAVVIGIVLDQKALRRLDARIGGSGGRIDDPLDTLEAGIGALSKRLQEDFLKLAALDADIMQRLERLEARSRG